MLIRSYCELPLECEPPSRLWLLFDLLDVSSAREGKLLLIRDNGVLLILRLWLLGTCSSNCIWGFDAIIAPRFRDPVCEAIYLLFFASLILVCFLASPGWLCLMSISALLITIFTGWPCVFFEPSLVLITNFCELFVRGSILYWEFLDLAEPTGCLPIIGEGDYFVVIVPPIFFCLLMIRAYLDGELWWFVVLCKAFKLRVCAIPSGSCAAWRLLPV